MAIVIDSSTYKPYEEKMDRTLEALQERLNGVRAGRANPRLLDKVTVEYYGAETPLNQVANITVPEARQLQIQPWDKSLLGEIEKAIYNANLGLTPNNDGESVRLNFPPLTEERRRELTKEVEGFGEESKVSIRNTRREFIDEIKQYEKDGDISEDVYHSNTDKIQDITDKYTAKVDEMIEAKEQELMEI